MERNMLFREVGSIQKDQFLFLDILKPVTSAKQLISQGDIYLQGQIWDPVPNPRINNGNSRKENSNRFKSKRTRPDGSTRFHQGLDILAKLDSPIYSTMAGKIISIDNSVPNDTDGGGGLGNTIVIETKDDNGKSVFMKYAHFNQNSKKLNLKEGNSVRAGQQIGISGNTGNIIEVSDEYKHVHIEAATNINFGDSRVNPEKYLRTKFNALGQPNIPTSRTISGNLNAASSTQNSFVSNPVKDKYYWFGEAMKRAQIDPKTWKVDKMDLNKGSVFDKVYTFYTDAFLQKNEIRWAAMAKLAGHVVLSGIKEIKAKSFFVANDILIIEILFRMQRAIFFDLSWQIEAFLQDGAQGISNLYAIGDIGRGTYDTWMLISSGDSKKILVGNMRLLEREQLNILDKYYKTLRTLFSDLAERYTSHIAASPIPGGKKFIDIIPYGDVTDFSDRWEWIEKDMWPKFANIPLDDLKTLVLKPLF
jgi:hypothetical protein